MDTQTPITANGQEMTCGQTNAITDAASSNNPAPAIILASEGPSARRFVMAAPTVRPI
jgi:hypothetical protein